MIFKEYLDKFLRQTIMIEEWCGNRRVTTHTVFGLGETSDCDDGTIDDMSNYLQLWEDGNCGQVTNIGINQEISLNKDAVVVTDTEGNKLDLFFFKGELISALTE